jgi:hypothetical protein
MRFIPRTPQESRPGELRCSIAAYETTPAADHLRTLHHDAVTYQRKVQQRLDELTKAGWFLAEYRDQVIDDAKAVRIP